MLLFCQRMTKTVHSSFPQLSSLFLHWQDYACPLATPSKSLYLSSRKSQGRFYSLWHCASVSWFLKYILVTMFSTVTLLTSFFNILACFCKCNTMRSVNCTSSFWFIFSLLCALQRSYTWYSIRPAWERMRPFPSPRHCTLLDLQKPCRTLSPGLTTKNAR